MKSPIEFIKEIENTYEVDKIKYNNFNVWQILRNIYINEYKKSIYNVKNKKDKKIKKLKNINIKVSNLLWQNKNYFKKYDYVLFTDSLEERNIENKISDKIAHNLIKILGKDLLIILNPIYLKHIKINDYYHKNYMCNIIFYLLRRLRKNKLRKELFEGESILKEIQNENQMQIDYLAVIDEFFKFTDIFTRYYDRCKPKLIFVNCYYDFFNQAAIYAAHKNSIRVIELQHGVINYEHAAYNIFKNIGKESFPDYIFTFGDYVNRYISNNLISNSKIVAIGNFYIEYVKSEISKNRTLIDYFSILRQRFKKIVVITSQEIIEDELISVIIKAAKISKDVLYIFIPRFYNKNFTIYGFPSNVIIHKKIDFYQTVGFCDFHITVYSSCALEAPYFGIPNILININNLSENYYREIFKDRDSTQYVDNYNELVHVIYNWNNKDKEKIVNIGNGFYKANNFNNIENALKIIVKSS